VAGCGVAGEGTGTPMLVFELGDATVTVGAATVAVLATVCVWAAGGDATAIRPDSDVAAATLPPLNESELTDNGFCAAGKIICGYCGKGNIMKTLHCLTTTHILKLNNLYGKFYSYSFYFLVSVTRNMLASLNRCSQLN
jgi:hypothetical protein